MLISRVRSLLDPLSYGNPPGIDSRLAIGLAAGMLAALVLAPTPGLAATVVLEPSEDNSMFEEDGALSNGAGIYLFMGITADGFARRALLRFDIAGNVPAGATITDATLSFQVNREPSGGAPDGLASLYRSQAPWGEEGSDAAGDEGMGAPAEPGDATWVFRTFNTVRWVTPGGELVQPVVDTELISGLGVYQFDGPELVTELQDMLEVPATNFGFIVVGDETGDRTARRFASRENPNASERPQLTIEYTPLVPVDEASVGRWKSGFEAP